MPTELDWWRTAVIYQIYPRSFADSNGDGVGDLPGITARLDALAELGVDAIWLSPFFTSPQHDAGYDVADYTDVDPLFGTLADFDALRDRAHGLGLKVMIDLVPNHSSSAHPWFQAALAAAPGSPERARYLFRDGLGIDGDVPPNNWRSVFGGPAWTRVTEPDGTPGQWYLHIFDTSQPDFDWTNEEVREFFRGVLRFWLGRGVDGFRVDVAHGLAKQPGLPDWTPDPDAGMADHQENAPYWGQPAVHEIYRDWHRVLEEFGTDRILAGEAWIAPLTRLANWVRPDEMQQTFNFTFLETPWQAAPLRKVVADSLAAFGGVGAPSTWVLSNHDVIRHATRLGLDPLPPQGQGVGPKTPSHPDDVVGLRRARAFTAFMLGLPGSAYLFQGEELGLPEVIDLPDGARQDPTFFRTGGDSYGRDGCRVPIPWTAGVPSVGFGPGSSPSPEAVGGEESHAHPTGASWLPQPSTWPDYARDSQRGIPGSTLEFYRAALAARREHRLASNELVWQPAAIDAEAPADGDADVLVYRSGAVTVLANTGSVPVARPAGRVVLASGPISDDTVPGDTTVWLVG
ncbi:MAG: glycoside hydrolase family 13 protein [Actinomycetota bacterium]|nr:glycoside hydrolase family 13 protein [Actinomycetota bacterium]